MKKCLNNRANHKNFDLLPFLVQIGLIKLKKHLKKIIPYFAGGGGKLLRKFTKNANINNTIWPLNIK